MDVFDSALAAPALAPVEEVRTRLAASGVGCTAQRLLVGRVLFARHQHVSAEQVLAMVAATGSRVSKATVYNTLNLFADRGLVCPLALGGDCTVFDSNTTPHHHLYDEESGELTDVAPSDVAFTRLPGLPQGKVLSGVQLLLRVRDRTP